MGFSGGHALMAVLTLTVGGLVFRQLTKRRDSDSTSKTDDVPGEGNEAPNTSEIEYDVFLSFRGTDTRNNIVDCLNCGLKHFGVHVFLDNEKLHVGKEIGGELLKALDKSRIYIPIFSKNYATSSWCLREVEYMEKCTSKSAGKKEILPIFYDVHPDEVKLKIGSYKRDIAKHKKKFSLDESKRWEDALVNVAHLKGWELKGKGLGELADSVVEEVLCKLNSRNVNVTKYLVEDQAQIEAIIKELEVGSDGKRFLGIHGIGGIGKTVLAKVVFNKLSHQFDGICFLEDVGKQSKHNPIDLQKNLLSSIAGYGYANQIKDLEHGMKWIKKACGAKKVLIVIDNLDEKKQLEILAGESNWFGSGSRIIITTRNKSILMIGGILLYEVREMEYGRALQLFCKHAFRRDSPIDGFCEFAKNIVLKVGKLPLAVEVIGSSLYCQSLVLEKHHKKIELWEETLKQLDEGPSEGVRVALMISYDQLEPKYKEVFLDIACFFTNEDQTYPIIMWSDYNYHPHRAISVLLLRSLIKIGEDNKFWMHDQIRDLGRYIILQEYPLKFNRVWIQEHAVKLLERKKENPDVEALSLTSNGCSRYFASEESANLPNLRFLRVKKSDFCGDFNNLLSKLRWLSWQTQQTTFHANNFHFSNLVVLDLQDSKIEDGWDGWGQMKMNKLKVLDLTGCISLKVTPDLSNFTSLEKLILARCVKLTTIDGSIGKLTHLRTLNIKGCRFLQELPIEIGSLQSLTEIIMPQNFQPFKLPDTFSNLESLSSFILDHHLGISQLPNSIGRLVKVTRLSLRGCVGIKKLPSSIGGMEMLAELDLSKSGIVELPDSIGYLKKLRVITVSYTVLRKFPHTIGQVEMLEELYAKKCYDLTDENLDKIGLLSYLRILDLSYTHVSRFPMVLGSLSCLQTLEMSSSHLQEVPDLPLSLTHLHMQAHHFPTTLDLSSLVRLDHVELYRLTISTEEPGQTWTNNLPEEQLIHPLPSNLSTMKFRGISLLPSFSNIKNLSVLCVIEYQMPHFSISQELINLTELNLSKCKLLVEIPGLSLLKNLQRLDLERLESLVEIPGLSELESLLYFRISRCDRIVSLPNLSKLDKLQHIELNACLKIRDIEGVKGLESLELDNRRCTILKRLLDVSRPTWLSHKVPMYDVFLNFRGPDTRCGIVDFIYHQLVQCQVRVFRNEDEIRLGQDFGRELSQVLDDCHIYIPVLSSRFTSSRWCLKELARIVKCTSMSNGNKRIIPIFYGVEIDDVNPESELCRRALDKYSRYFGNEVEEWKMALREVAHIKGFNAPGNRSLVEVVESVTREVLNHLMDVNAEFD